MAGVYIKAIAGQTYVNRNGGTYLCRSTSFGSVPARDMRAVFERQPDGWTLVVHGVEQYEDGTIEWDFSTGGYWPGGWPKNWKHEGGPDSASSFTSAGY